MSKKIKVLWILVIALTAAAVLSACQSSEEPEPVDDGKLHIYTSFYPMYDFAAAISEGAPVSITNFVPAGTNPHDWEPTLKEMKGLKKADVFIYSGKGMESWIDKILPYAGNRTTKVEASKKAADLGGDPHTWLDPLNAMDIAEVIRGALVTVDPDHKEIYENNTDKLTSLLNQLDDKYSAYIKNAPKKTIVVSHAAYGYLCNAYGLEQLSIEGVTGESDPSPAKMAELVERIQQEGIKYVFYDPSEGSKVAEALAQEAGVQTLELNSFESGPEGKTYLEVMEENLRNLQKALYE